MSKPSVKARGIFEGLLNTPFDCGKTTSLKVKKQPDMLFLPFPEGTPIKLTRARQEQVFRMMKIPRKHWREITATVSLRFKKAKVQK